MSKAINILMVEDSENDTQLLMGELRRHGYEPTHRRVETSRDMQAAIKGHKWDVVVSDYTMPQFSGADALKLFNGLELDIPFIFVSGTYGEEAAVRMMKAGADDYFVKGNLARLVPAIEREMESARARRAQVRAEMAMHHLAAIVESSRDAIYGMDLDSTIISWNPAAERIFGYSADEIIGRLIPVLFPLSRRDELLETVASIRQGKLAGVYETERRRKDGRVINVSITCSPITNAEGKITGASVIARDISRQTQDEEDRLKLIKDLTAALNEVKTLAGLLPICAACNRIRGENDTWSSIETYVAGKSAADLNPGTCPECSARLGAGTKK
ncbi:MAG TPA: PAS domain S-box protein [Verrucomicrobiae bacterium]|nr:PAS domain S-box protein [Verrucomicrobiae bacterium]